MIMFWATLLAVSIVLYVVLDGFDLGVGILSGVTRSETKRCAMLAAVEPIWDGNETWLVVTAANIFAEPLRRGTVTIDTLKQVQQRREFPTRVTQRLQIIMQNNVIRPALANKNQRPRAPLFMKMMQWPLLRRLPGRLLAFGVRPEHIHAPAAVMSAQGQNR